MFRVHLQGHGLTYARHLHNNWQLTLIAIKSACYTLGHGLIPIISGRRASELHNELWTRGRALSLEDLQYRLKNNLYPDQTAARKDFHDYASLYNEQPVIEPFTEVIDQYYQGR